MSLNYNTKVLYDIYPNRGGEGKVQTLIVYKRDRLQRNFFEHVDISKLLMKYGVEVVFTASNEPPFSTKIALEGFYGIFGQVEGKNIQTRTSDARKQFPPRIFGFERITDKDNNVKYVAKEAVRKSIKSLFEKCSNINNSEDFIELVIENKKVFKKPEQVIKILQNPFYTAHMETRNGLLALNHVEQIVPLDLFLSTKEKLDRFFDEYQKLMLQKVTQQVTTPFCGLCDKEMKYINKDLKTSGYFVCSSNHRRISIEQDEFRSELERTVAEEVSKITPKIAEEIINKSIQRKRKEIVQTKDQLSTDFKFANIKLCTLKQSKDFMNKVEEQLSIIKALQNSFEKITTDEFLLNEVQEELTEAITLSDEIKSNINDGNLQKLINLLVDKVAIYDDYMMIDLYLAEFLKGADVT